MQQLAGRIAVITGAASGIGAAMAWHFARSGMKIVAADLDEAALAAACKELAEAGHAAVAVRTNVADAAAVEALAERAYATFGDVDPLCNNAGVVPLGRYRAVWEFPLEDWRWSLDVNLYGVIHGLRSFIPRMLGTGDEGRVRTTASVAGFISGSGSVVYSAVKHAAVRLIEALHASLHERDASIGVSLLCPSLVSTRIYESERNRPGALRPASGPAPETEELQAIGASLDADAMAPGPRRWRRLPARPCSTTASTCSRPTASTTRSASARRPSSNAVIPSSRPPLALSRGDIGGRERRSPAPNSPSMRT
jgi:NAD(P)-dependent dehydrogenase (short-subunit alcohol dehydrogenase family)